MSYPLDRLAARTSGYVLSSKVSASEIEKNLASMLSGSDPLFHELSKIFADIPSIMCETARYMWLEHG
jgi:hypothetical protein